ncbi:hypothetical protein MUK42_16174 [Musa troglodytarum]|uniref:Uncharacterized protein n=1 Tax=Musa troglodytarum TaxID=320322 RepID=A0A9E7KN15_9LILI|nr:hypothetical protein MUK42_16174 [Musa troglodytarum]
MPSSSAWSRMYVSSGHDVELAVGGDQLDVVRGHGADPAAPGVDAEQRPPGLLRGGEPDARVPVAPGEGSAEGCAGEGDGGRGCRHGDRLEQRGEMA